MGFASLGPAGISGRRVLRLLGSSRPKVTFESHFSALIDPGAQQTDLFRRKAAAFLRHDGVGIKSLDEFDQQAFVSSCRERSLHPYRSPLRTVSAGIQFAGRPCRARDRGN